MATSIPILTPSDSRRSQKPATDLREAIWDLTSFEDEEAASRRLLEKLMSFSTGNVDIVEVGQTQLRFLQADGQRSQFRIHPQGMEIDRTTGLIYVTAVEIIEERDKARQYWGKGRAHLFECNVEGRTLRSVNLRSDNEDEYHPSGMVLVDGMMFIALAQYAPETSATIIKFNIKDWTYEKLFSIQDHIGLVVPNLDEGEVFLGTWGSRHYYCTDLRGNIKSKHPSPCSDTMEHQDAQLMRGRMDILNSLNPSGREVPGANRKGTLMVATGVSAGAMEYFGFDIVDVTNFKVEASHRWPSAQYLTKGGWPPFANPTFLWVDSYDRILALALPDCDHEQIGKVTTLLLYALSPHQ